MPNNGFSNVVGFDDAPFPHGHAGTVPVVGAVFAGSSFEGMLLGEVTKDGFDAAEVLARLVNDGKFSEHIQLVLLQGITMGGFNVVDVFHLHESTGMPVIAVVRKQPNIDAFRDTLLRKIPGGKAKWGIVERLGPVEPLDSIFIQRVGISFNDAADTIRSMSVHGSIPEPLRTAHLIAGALVLGQSRGRA